MEVGRHKERREEWSLREKTITKCDTYKYLGEEIARDGKNKTNLEERFKKVKNIVMAIMTCARNDVMRNIETQVLIKLHDTVTLPAFLYNAETWVLNCSERKEVDKVEIWAWKHMLGLPITTPNPAVVFATGSLYASVRVDQKRLVYLQQLLQKPKDHWAQMALNLMNDHNCGWAKSINETLESWDLERQWNNIAKKSKVSWKTEVTKAAEKINTETIRKECYKRVTSSVELKSKSKSIIQELDRPDYKRKPLEIMSYSSVIAARATIMGRYGMLQCKKNFFLVVETKIVMFVQPLMMKTIE